MCVLFFCVQDKKRALRASPARTKKALAAVTLSSDDDAVTAIKVAKRKQVVKKPVAAGQTKVAAKQQNQPVLGSPFSAGLYGREYHLRSKDNTRTHQLLSSDEESSPVVVRKTRKDTSASTRMSLTESNFKRRLADINKRMPTEVKTTSTPQPRNPTNQSPQVKTKLKFDSSQLRRSGRTSGGPVLTIEQVTEDESSKKVPTGNNLSIIAEAEDDLVPKEETPVIEEEVGGENYPAWPPVGWKEFVLAAFVTGLAAVGYVCYTTDYCSYC